MVWHWDDSQQTINLYLTGKFNMVYGKGYPNTFLTAEDIREIIQKGTTEQLYSGKRVLVLTPDATRTCPLPMLIRAVNATIGHRCSQLDFMVALGTHPVMPELDILELYGISARERKKSFQKSSFFCHRWDLPETFTQIGQLPAEDVGVISGGLLEEDVPIEVNRKIYDYDLVLILGPVFPHEVVGYSGGAKYVFPGISGGEFLHFFHWLGAVITCKEIIGKKETPVRQLIDLAMQKIDRPVHCLAMVVNPEAELCGLFAGGVKQAWSAAADLSSQIHVVTKKKPFRIVVGRAPDMFDEIWTAGKVMYKLEQVVARRGQLIIYAPHIHLISRTWGKYIETIGYHIRDYFLSRMADFKDIPRGVLAHATHVRGTGTYEEGVETPDVEVILATSIPKEKCERINLGYMNPDGIRIEDFMGKEAEGILYVDPAGESLYRLEET
jgi:nickel-dependent lactate racemase